jgi:hypothetical protein
MCMHAHTHSGLPPRRGLPLSENVFHAFHPIIGVALGGGTRPAQPPTLTAMMTPSSVAIIMSDMVQHFQNFHKIIVFFTIFFKCFFSNFQFFDLPLFSILFFALSRVHSWFTHVFRVCPASGRCHLAVLCPEHGFSPLPIDPARRAYDVHALRGGEVVTRWSQRAHTFTFTLCDSHAQTRRAQQVRAVVLGHGQTLAGPVSRTPLIRHGPIKHTQ